MEDEVAALRARVGELEGLLEKAEREKAALRASAAELQNRAEAEEELIANTLLKKLDDLTAQKNQLLVQVEQEEEYLTNTLQKKLFQLEKEKTELENQLEEEQEFIVNKLQRQLQSLNQEKSALDSKIEELQLNNSELARTKIALKTLQTQTHASIQNLERENFLLSQHAEKHGELFEKLTKELGRLELSHEMEEEREFHSRYSPSTSPSPVSFLTGRSRSSSPSASESNSLSSSRGRANSLPLQRTLKEGIIFFRENTTDSLRHRFAVLTVDNLYIFPSEPTNLESPLWNIVLDKVLNVNGFSDDSFFLELQFGRLEFKCRNAKEAKSWTELIESLLP